MADKTGSLLQCLCSPVGSGETKVFDLLRIICKLATNDDANAVFSSALTKDIEVFVIPKTKSVKPWFKESLTQKFV